MLTKLMVPTFRSSNRVTASRFESGDQTIAGRATSFRRICVARGAATP
jgi:hypothetical protein